MITTGYNISLKQFNTFGIESIASKLITFSEPNDCHAVFNEYIQPHESWFVLAGGSNVLLPSRIHSTIIQPKLTGYQILSETTDCVEIKVNAGVEWDDFVEICVKNNWHGIENLSAIPGHVGAAPIQNIGAYGVEAGDKIKSVTGYHVINKEFQTYKKEDCEFGYRTSVFKTKLKTCVIITSVEFTLNKHPNFNLTYGNIKNEVEKLGGISLINVRLAIVSIRQSKLPDYKVMGNAGSFFKNPVVSIDLANTIKTNYPLMPSYPINDTAVKVPAGWLIEASGWKGRSLGNAAVHSEQALVLINKGSATSKDVLELAHAIQNDVKILFGIDLEMEVNILE